MKSIVSLLADPVSYDVRHATLVPFLGRSVAWRDKTFALAHGDSGGPIIRSNRSRDHLFISCRSQNSVCNMLSSRIEP